MLAPIYACPKCGKVWKVYADEIPNNCGDGLETVAFCQRCDSVVRPLLGESCHVLTPDEVMDWDANYDEASVV